MAEVRVKFRNLQLDKQRTGASLPAASSGTLPTDTHVDRDTSVDSQASHASSAVSAHGRGQGYLAAIAKQTEDKDAKTRATTVARTEEFASARDSEDSQQPVSETVQQFSTSTSSASTGTGAAVVATLACLPAAKGLNVSETSDSIPEPDWTTTIFFIVGDTIQVILMIIGSLWVVYNVCGYFLPDRTKTALRQWALWFIAPGPPTGTPSPMSPRSSSHDHAEPLPPSTGDHGGLHRRAEQVSATLPINRKATASGPAPVTNLEGVPVSLHDPNIVEFLSFATKTDLVSIAVNHYLNKYSESSTGDKLYQPRLFSAPPGSTSGTTSTRCPRLNCPTT